jgi:hypothetical protein
MKRENDYDLIFWLTVFILVGVMVFMAFFDNLAKASTTPIVTISGGQSVLNSLQDQHGTAFQLDQRQALGFNMRGERWGYDAGYINLGHQAGLKTDGLFGLYQVRFFKGSVSTFAGVGPCFLATTVPTGMGGYQDRYGVALMTQLGIAYKVGDWRIQGAWERMTTFHNLDEDVFLVGIGHTL